MHQDERTDQLQLSDELGSQCNLCYPTSQLIWDFSACTCISLPVIQCSSKPLLNALPSLFKPR